MSEYDDQIAGLRRRVFAYIIRESDRGYELLVFRHRDYPDAGIQVPGGGIEPGEYPDDALLREIREESGIEGITILAKLAPISQTDWGTVAFPYLIEANLQLPNSWEFTTNDYHDEHAKERGECPLVFCYEWIPLPIKGVLNGPQEEWLDLLMDCAPSQN